MLLQLDLIGCQINEGDNTDIYINLKDNRETTKDVGEVANVATLVFSTKRGDEVERE